MIKRMIKSIILAAILIVVLTIAHSCTETKNKEVTDQGFDDGYASGYNLLCANDRRTLIEGNWENEHYSKAYVSGYRTGVLRCHNKI